MARGLDRKDTIAWRRCRGMNNWDSPDDLDDDICVLASNVQFEQGGLGKKRSGTVYQALTFPAAPPGYAHLANFVPAGGAAVAELVIVGETGTLFTVRVGTTALSLTLADAMLDAPPIVHTAQLNNKLYLAYRSAVNRLHLLPAGETVVRRAGLSPAAAPVVTNEGPAGLYPATLRYYRVRWERIASTTGQRAGPLGPATAFTPSGTQTGARITMPAQPNEGENGWAVYVSADNATYYRLRGLAVPPGDAPFTIDTALVGTWTGELAPLEGANTNWPSVKFLCSTGDRLLGFGVHNPTTPEAGTMTPLPGRVYFSPVLNTSDYDDDERVSNTLQAKGWIDIARNAGGDDRGIAEAIDNQIMVAQSEGLYLLIPTGQDTAPYRRVALSPTLGWVSQWSTFAGEDESGRPALYFLDVQRGPYRYGARGLEWLGYDIQTSWKAFDKNAPPVACHGVYLPATRECRWWIPTVAGTPGGQFVINFNVNLGRVGDGGDIHGGWSHFTGRPGTTALLQQARTSVMFSETFANPRSAVVRAYMGFLNAGLGVPILLRMDVDGVYEDGQGTARVQPYVGYLTSKAWLVAPDQNIKQIIRAWLKAKAGDGVVITMGAFRNYEEEHRYSSVILTPAAAVISPPPISPFQQGRVQRRFNDASLTDAFAFQIALGDPGLINSGADGVVQGWTLDQWFATIEYGDET